MQGSGGMATLIRELELDDYTITLMRKAVINYCIVLRHFVV